jgi:hypothetical protein
MSPPTSIDSTRRWFLGLPQLQKTLVFGGLGLLSGWVTALSFLIAFASVEFGAGLVTAALTGGFCFGTLVAWPNAVLGLDSTGRQIASVPLAVIVHTLAITLFVALMEMPAPFYAGSSVGRDAMAASAGLIAGGLLAMACVPRSAGRRGLVFGFTAIGLATAAWLLGRLQTNSLHRFVGFWDRLEPAFRGVLTLVTLHSVAAVCLSLRKWPQLADAFAPPPPVDDPAKLPV